MNARTSLGPAHQGSAVIGLIDVGTSKIVSFIVATPRTSNALGGVRVLGAGVVPARGVSAGVVVGLDAAEHAVRAAVGAAERVAGIRVDEVVVAVGGCDLDARRLSATTSIEGRIVTRADIERTLDGAKSYAERDGRALLHLDCLGYRLDAARGIEDPLGLAGTRLGADLITVTTREAPLSNLLHVLERAYLTPLLIAPAPYASALAATSTEDRQDGVIAIDMGAGSTGLAAFANGRLEGAAVIPVGGNHITAVLAGELAAAGVEAERIKRECGTLQAGAPDEHEVLLYVPAGADAGALRQTTRGLVRASLRQSLGAVVDRIAQFLAQVGPAARGVRLAVLSGAASQQAGLVALAAGRLGMPVRAARIAPLGGLPQACSGPDFAVAVGLAQVAIDPARSRGWRREGGRPSGYLRQIGEWLRESF